MLSDSDTSDSDSGIRFKTDSTRNLSHHRHHHHHNSNSSTTAAKSLASSSGTSSTNRNHHHSRDYHSRRSPSNERSSRHRSSNERSTHNSRSSYNEKDREHSKKPQSRSRSKSRDKVKERERTNYKDPQPVQSSQKIDRDKDREKEREKSNKTKPLEIKKSKHKKSKKEKEPSNDNNNKEPNLVEKLEKISTSKANSSTIIEEDTFGPMLPPSVIVNVNLSDNSSIISDSEHEIDLFGPALPPSVTVTSNAIAAIKPDIIPETKKTIGPTIPENIHEEILMNLQQSSGTFTESVDMNAEDISDEEDESDFVVGPLPLGVVSKTNLELEKRALELKITKLNNLTNSEDSDKDLSKIREEWMLELPEVKSVTGLGLQARQFRAKAGPDFSDRTMWTDTPDDKLKKLTNKPTDEELKKIKQKELELLLIEKRNDEQEEIIKKHKKKHKQERNESLLELHQKKISKKKKKLKNDSDNDNKLSNRRPFSREIDLKVNHFDDAKKKLLIKKAQLLDTRFSSGHSKFL